MATPFHLRQAVRVLNAGGVVAYPTETVFGLGCNPLDYRAVARILQLKRRPREKGLILIGARLDHLLPFIDVTDPAQLNKLNQPGERPTTWICPVRDNTPDWICGAHHSIAVRISSSPVAQQLCDQFGGALVSTSANPSSLPPARNALAVRGYFGEQLDYILNDHHMSHNQPSRIIDLISGKVIRN